jgi:hypothetical protein
LKKKLLKLNKLIKNTISKKFFKIEMVFFIGVFIVIFTNFLINLCFGLYSIGFSLIAYSIFSFKFTGRGGDNK